MKILESYIATANEGDEGNVAVYEILGKLYSNEGKFDLAVQNYQRHYKALAENPSDKDALRSAMVNLGIATANSKMNAYFKAVVDPKCIDGLLTWKASRSLEGL